MVDREDAPASRGRQGGVAAPAAQKARADLAPSRPGPQATLIAAHADWSIDATKRWLAVARPRAQGWQIGIEPVGPLPALLPRLLARAEGGPVLLGVDFPLGLPRAYVRLHAGPHATFLDFLRSLSARPQFFEVAATIEEVCAERPFYPCRGLRGMTRLAHALALGLDSAAGLSRACDRATADRPAGAPLFWTLGANQSGKAAISAWRDLLLPALALGTPLSLWPFEGPLLPLLQPGRIVIAEAYPADALRQIGLRPIGSKRRQSDREALTPGLREAMTELDAVADPSLSGWLECGFGADANGEDRLDCLVGLLGVLRVLAGRSPDAPPPDPWLTRWEGWVLGQAPNALQPP